MPGAGDGDGARAAETSSSFLGSSRLLSVLGALGGSPRGKTSDLEPRTSIIQMPSDSNGHASALRCGPRGRPEEQRPGSRSRVAPLSPSRPRALRFIAEATFRPLEVDRCISPRIACPRRAFS